MLPAPELDIEGLRANLLMEREPERVYIFEHALDETVRAQIAERFGLLEDVPRDDPAYLMKRDVAIHRFLGMELFRVWLPGTKFSIYNEGWVDERSGPTSRSLTGTSGIPHATWARSTRSTCSRSCAT